MTNLYSEETIDNLLRLLEDRDAQLDIAKGVLRMAVDRLGGIVEGKPTHEGNFLQRIDELRRIEDRESGWSKDYDSLARKLDECEKREAQLLDVVKHLTKDGPPHDKNGDWACVECKPHSDMLIEGFQCAYHRGLTLIATVEGARPEEG